MIGRHLCEHAGCSIATRGGRPLCTEHWRRVPEALRHDYVMKRGSHLTALSRGSDTSKTAPAYRAARAAVLAAAEPRSEAAP